MSDASTTRPASAFWNFSLRIYGKPNVPSACIVLQENAGLDVNVLLFCLYAAFEERVVADSDVKRVLATTEPWKDNVVVNLRRARVYLRTPAAFIDAAGASILRNRLKGLELEAERLQQEGLYAAFPSASFGAPALSRQAAARDNVAALEKAMGVAFDQTAVGVILAAFDTLGD